MLYSGAYPCAKRVTAEPTMSAALSVAPQRVCVCAHLIQVAWESCYFFKQKTAYEIYQCDWSQTCALPICCSIRAKPPDDYGRFELLFRFRLLFVAPPVLVFVFSLPGSVCASCKCSCSVGRVRLAKAFRSGSVARVLCFSNSATSFL